MNLYKVIIKRKDGQPLINQSEEYVCNMIADDDLTAKKSAFEKFRSGSGRLFCESELEYDLEIK